MEDRGSRLLLNVGIFVPESTASHLRLLIFTSVKFSDSFEVVSTVYIKKELELGCYINRKLTVLFVGYGNTLIVNNAQRDDFIERRKLELTETGNNN